MKFFRRELFKKAGMAGAALLVPAKETVANMATAKAKTRQSFNMCGYRAPKLPRVGVGFIGLGNRGPSAVNGMRRIEGVDIVGLCDVRESRVEFAASLLVGTPHQPALYSGSVDGWRSLCENPLVDVIHIATPWHLHAPMALYAMECGKHVMVEVPAAKTLDECWALVETSEKTRRHCIILENCCYDFFELLSLNLAQLGLFGEIVHAEGAYIHNLLEGNFSKTKYYDFWRLKENLRNGNLYPTHGLGPVAQSLKINRGDRLTWLTSMSSFDFQMGKRAAELAATDETYLPFVNQRYRGNMNSTIMKTNLGKTVLIQHDVTSPNVYSRKHVLIGTRGSCQKYPTPPRIAFGHTDWLDPVQFEEIQKQYSPPIVGKVGALAKEIGGHGGMDFMMYWRIVDCLRNGLPMDIDVYDAATWSAVAPLSEASVAANSAAIEVPDFTRGAWTQNLPVDLSLTEGGNTGVIK